MDVKQAVKIAKDYVNELLAEEGLTNLGLEEIEFDQADRSWNVTLGFSRPWNSMRNGFTALSGNVPPGRSYRVVKVRDEDGQVVSLKKHELAD
ncbi:hypothetical protein [Jiella sp. M17.18]|uniref:hypothetical protein n=1 Tax=Jiella sp. M17.18 TaxID=3234247 RepID=UPI0034DEA396